MQILITKKLSALRTITVLVALKNLFRAQED